jgi:acyl-CoA reductase-like NAD-dependent aldehyde dehydrogenase
MHYEMLIAGHRVGGVCDYAIGKEVIRSPFDGSVVATVAEGGWSELSTAISAASEACASWSDSSALQRQGLRIKIADLIQTRRDEFVELLVLEAGIPITSAEIDFSEAEKHFRDLLEIDFVQEESQVSFLQFDFPCMFSRIVREISLQLQMGNVVVIKPSNNLVAIIFLLGLTIHEAGCPDGVVNTWNGSNVLMTKVMKDSRVANFFYHGLSTNFKERGIKSGRPFSPWQTIVLNETNLDSLDLLIDRRMKNLGMDGSSAMNYFVESDIYPVFRENLLSKVSNLKVGDPKLASTDVGPMPNEQASKILEKYTQQAVQAGAKVLFSKKSERNICCPLVLENVPKGCGLLSNAILGPIITLESFTDRDALISRLNEDRLDFDFGGTYIFGKSNRIEFRELNHNSLFKHIDEL